MKYRPEIDGLRAFAVVPVILFHAGFSVFQGGFVGVDIFFVISGYLITGILLGELQNGTFSILRFYERRARRILPALLAMIVVIFGAAWFILPPIEMTWFGESVFATALFLSNFYFLFRSSDYFAGATAEYPLLHTWSLAVEEQFYIIFPILLWLFWRWGPRSILGMVVVLVVASLATSEVLSRVNVGMNFYLLPSRFWELGIGALCAYAHFSKPRQDNEWAALAGFVLLIGSILFLSDAVRFPSVWALPPVIGTALIVLYAGPSTVTGRALSWGPFIWIGLASYSAYLWHQPLFALMHVRFGSDLGWPIMLGLSGLSILLGYVSLKLVEAPFRKRGTGTSLRVVFASGVALAAFAAAGIGIHLSNGLPSRTAAPHLPADYYAAVERPSVTGGPNTSSNCATDCTLVAGPDAQSAKILLIGDSHAQDLQGDLARAAEDRGWQLDLFVYTGCTLTRLSNDQRRCARALQKLQEKDLSGYDQVLLLTRFSDLYEPNAPEEVTGAVEDYAALVERFASSAPSVVWFAPRAQLNADPIRSALANRIDSIGLKADFLASDYALPLLERVAGLSNVTTLDQRAFLAGLASTAPADFKAHTPENLPLYRDRGHLSGYAAEIMTDWYLSEAAPGR